MNEQVLNFNDLPTALSLVINQLKEIDSKISLLSSQFQSNKENEWLTVTELCAYIPTHPVEHTIYCWTSSREIPYHKRGKRIMFLKSEIDEWLKGVKGKSKHEIQKEAEEYVLSIQRKNRQLL